MTGERVCHNIYTERHQVRRRKKPVYKLSLKGNTRYAEYDVDEKEDTCTRTHLEVFDERDKDDCLSLVIVDPATRSNLEENWMVLHGKPWQISLTMDLKYQIAKMETNRIFDFLDTVGRDDVVTLIYPIEEPSWIIGQSKIHRAMRAYAAEAIQDMFGFDAVYRLPERSQEKKL